MSMVDAEEVAALEASGQFDAAWYVERYPDVAASGMSAHEHYLWLGRRLRRQGRKPLPDSEDISFEFDALFLDGTNGTSSTPYRVFRIANALAGEGWRVRSIKGEDLFRIAGERINARFLVVHRAPWWSPYVEFVEKMRSQGTIIVYDIDDLVFDEEMIRYIDGLRYLGESDRQPFLDGVRAYRNFILNADMCTSTTNYLVEHMATLGKPVFRVRNAISEENIQFFENIGYRRRGRPTPFVIGYYSGTKTHQADFSVAAPALVQFMNENPDVAFRLVGNFDLDEYPELAHWQHIHRPGDLPRTTKVGLMAHDAMVRDQFNCDLIIAPLEVGNPFCEAKSELKFFEASLAKCPVIASSTRTFIEAMHSGLLGDVALTTDDWLRAFRDIYANYDMALTRAGNAYDYVRTHYSQRFAGMEALDAYEGFENRRRGTSVTTTSTQETLPQWAEIGVILPDFSGPSGGHRKIFAVCEAIEKAGKTVKLYFYSIRPTKFIKKDIERLFCHLNAEVSIYDGHAQEHELIICTQWKTAYDFRRDPARGRVVYFVQDFEPLFFPAGSDHVRAQTSYTMGYELICYGDWVARKLRDEFETEARVIPFTLDHKTYGPGKFDADRDIDILLFARSSQDRRCLDLITEGLAELKRRRPDVRIGLFGEHEYDNLGFDFTNFGSFDDLERLSALYRRTKVGICYSPTNPSQLGYEMVACGVCLVDIRVKFSDLNFGGEEFVSYCSGTPESMSTICEELLDSPENRAHRQAAGYEFVARMPDDIELGRAFINAAGLI